MPRALRLQDAGYVHHVVCRGNDRQILFNSPQDFQEYLFLLDKFRSQFSLNIYNYVLMSNHVHLLVEPLADGGLSKVMEEVSKGYAKYFNKTNDRVGHVFQGRFKSFLVQKERYFFMCSRYIDLNPVKANIVNDPAQYIWSGYRSLANGSEVSLRLDKHSLYEGLGMTPEQRQIAYRALVLNIQMEEMDLLNKRAGVLGDKEFKRQFKSED